MDTTSPRRHDLRLAGYDYSQPGSYFVTICTHGRACTLGQIDDTGLSLSLDGSTVEQSWRWLQARYCYVTLDAFVVMPNHLHGILTIASLEPTISTRKPLGRLLASFKTVSAHRINTAHATPGQLVWQRGYFEHVIRNDASLMRIRSYIESNPDRWSLDPQNPQYRAPATRTNSTPDEPPWMV